VADLKAEVGAEIRPDHPNLTTDHHHQAFVNKTARLPDFASAMSPE